MKISSLKKMLLLAVAPFFFYSCSMYSSPMTEAEIAAVVAFVNDGKPVSESLPVKLDRLEKNNEEFVIKDSYEGRFELEKARLAFAAYYGDILEQLEQTVLIKNKIDNKIFDYNKMKVIFSFAANNMDCLPPFIFDTYTEGNQVFYRVCHKQANLEVVYEESIDQALDNFLSKMEGHQNHDFLKELFQKHKNI
jgi:hypothetical protein